jgi:FMN-dependent oxidoreductase (nitrilotriacetate monooxygenase family)
MAAKSQQLHIFAFPHTGPLAWRQNGAYGEGEMDFAVYRKMAQDAERGLFDAIFIADNVSLNHWYVDTQHAKHIGNAATFEPMTLLAALAAVTQHIGLMATMSTTYNHPYHVARKLASLDHLSGGRAGWNVVTSMTEPEAANFGLHEQVPSAERYVRANEFVDVVKALWDSWDDDAFIRNKQTGQFYDPAKAHPPRHHGKHFDIAGPLNIPRSPQGHPVICQAGRSEDGLDLAARTADLIFVNHKTMEGNQAIYKAMKERAGKFGRTPDQLRVIPGVFVVIGGTEEEAHRKLRDARDSVDMPTAKAFLAPAFPGIDFTDMPDDEPPPRTPEFLAAAAESRFVLEKDGKPLTLREMCTGYGNQHRQLQVIGTPEQAADMMELWLKAGAADGFNLVPLAMPDGFEGFADEVVPLLQKRGVYREAYEGKTLRENLGFARPDLVSA